METPEPPHTPASKRLIRLPAVWLAAGLLVGGGIAVAIMSAIRPPATSNIVLQSKTDPEKPVEPIPDNGKSSSGDPALLSPKDGAGDTKAKTSSPSAEYAADRNPTESRGGVAQPKPLPGGSIGTGGMTEPLTPTVIVGDPPASQVEHFEFRETMAETEFDGELAQVLSAIRAAGGQVLAQYSRDPERPERGTEVYASIATKGAGKLRESLKLSAGAETSHWTGTPVERSGRMLRMLRDERSRLATLLVDYQARFLDDASQVVDTKAALERVDRAIGAVGKAGEGTTTFIVLLGR